MVKIHEGHFVNISAMELLIVTFTCSAGIIFFQMGLMVTALFFINIEY